MNDVRFGYDRVWFIFNTDDGTKFADGTGYPINTGAQFPGLPDINLSGFEKLGSWHNRPQRWANNYYDIQDNVSYLMGKHTLRFGVEGAIIDVTNSIPDTGRGLIAFSKASSRTHCWALPVELSPSQNHALLWTSSPDLHREEIFSPAVRTARRSGIRLPRSLRMTCVSLQDCLSESGACAYSYVTPIHEINGLWGNFDPTKGLIQQSAGGSLYKSDPRDLSPRAGFAWDVDGKGTTVVRGGFSINYSFITAVTFLNQNGFTAPGATSVALPAVPTGAVIETNGLGTGPTAGGSINLQSASFSAKQKLNWNGKVFGTPTAACGDGVGLDASPCNIMAVDPNLTTPYITSYSIGIQHSFGNNLSLELGYVGNKGSRLTGFRDINQIPAGALPTGTNLTGRPYGDATRFPYLQWIIQNSNDGHSNYNSLQASLTKRISHGLSFIAGYTYGHGLDTGTLNRTGYLPQDSQNVAGEYGNSDFDIRHRFTFTATYDIPGIRGYAQMLEGWKINTIVTLQSAQPWQMYDSNNSFCEGDGTGSVSVADFTCRWNLTGPSSAFRSGPNGIPYCSSGAPGGCGITSGINGNTTPFTDAQTASMWQQCVAAAGPAANANLLGNGCYVSGNSVITPPANGTYGNIGRNIFRDSGFKDMDFSVFKIFTFRERYSAQFRLEIFNLLNHPISANPYGGANGYGVGNDPSVGSNGGGLFGCGCATADVAAGSPQIGSGGARGMQLGLKLAF